MLEVFGAELMLTPGEEGSNGAVRRAVALADEHPEWVFLYQYGNEANPRAHYLTTGPEIYADCPEITHFVAGLGTSGTLLGVGTYLKEQRPDIQVMAVEPPSGELVEGLRSLEDGYIPPVFDKWGGFDLLERIGKGVALTPRGQRYASDVRKALTVLGDAVTRHAGTGVGGSFSVSCTPGFASLFLCTHIGEFRQMYPDVALRILTPRRLDDVSNAEADAFIAFGVGNWPNRAVELLCEISFTPLCSPTLLNKVGGFSKPADVLRANLLHLGDTEDWARWLALSKVENPDTEGGIFFSDMNLVFSAAIAG